jgi:hypothetical protein
MGRSILAIIVGIIIGGFVALLIEIPGMLMHRFPPGTDLSDVEAMKRHMASAPTAALVGIAIAWSAAPLAGAWIAGLIARRAFFLHGLIIGGFFLAADVLNIRAFPHPGWLSVIGIVAPPLAAWLGATLAGRMVGGKTSTPQPYDMRQKNMAC